MGEKLRHAKGTALTHESSAAAKVSEQLVPASQTIFAGKGSQWRSFFSSCGFLAVFVVSAIYVRNPALVLFLGTATGLALPNPSPRLCKKAAGWLLGLSITGIGASSNLTAVLATWDKVPIVVAVVAAAIFMGLVIGRLLRVPRRLMLLIASGTAICGGSAIMATSEAIDSSEDETVVALTTVFLLNALSLVLLPVIGSGIGMSETQFGVWSALAIHDTGSVIAASIGYGPVALEQATTVKLLRALFIVPMVATLALTLPSQTTKLRHPLKRIPWFIPAFLLAAGCAYVLPTLHDHREVIVTFSKICMLGAMFLLGTTLTRRGLSVVGLKPFVMGLLLWVSVAVLSFGLAMLG